MKLRTATAAIMLAFLCASTAAESGTAHLRGNSLVGLWSSQGEVRPCGTTLPPSITRNTILFHAGGTLTEIARFPLDGVPGVYGVPGNNKRGTGLGTWDYNPRTHEYLVSLQFDWYVDGMYHGYQTVERSIHLDGSGDQGEGPVTTTRYGIDGSVIAESCGTAVSTRL